MKKPIKSEKYNSLNHKFLEKKIDKKKKIPKKVENEKNEKVVKKWEKEEKENKISNRRSLFNDDYDIMDYYKVKTGNIKFSVFNYNQNIAVEVKGFNKESKVEQLIKEEKEKSRPQSSKENNNKSISFQVGTNLSKQDTEKKIWKI